MNNEAYPYTLKRLEVQPGLELAYLESGSGEQTVLFVHGLGSNRKAWLKNMQGIGSGYRCISLDLPGYGASSMGTFPSTLSYYVEVLNRFIEKSGLKRVTLAGHSMGGQIALLLAAHHPSWLNSLILAAPAGFETFESHEAVWLESFFSAEILQSLSIAQIERNIAANFYQFPEDAQFMVTDRIALSNDVIRFPLYCRMVSDNVRAMLQEPVKHLLSSIKIPVMIIVGESDRLIPNKVLHPFETVRSVAKRGASALPHSELHFIPKCGHFVQWEGASQFNHYLQSFVPV